eukprot:5248906-Amphidinium_carterae.3
MTTMRVDASDAFVHAKNTQSCQLRVVRLDMHSGRWHGSNLITSTNPLKCNAHTLEGRCSITMYKSWQMFEPSQRGAAVQEKSKQQPSRLKL